MYGAYIGQAPPARAVAPVRRVVAPPAVIALPAPRRIEYVDDVFIVDASGHVTMESRERRD